MKFFHFLLFFICHIVIKFSLINAIISLSISLYFNNIYNIKLFYLFLHYWVIDRLFIQKFNRIELIIF